jgi:hypothetical protein
MPLKEQAPMKPKTLTALSFWQPYAWLIVNGHAEVDSRTWAPPEKRIGERIAVHASKRRVTRAEFDDFQATVRELGIRNAPTSPDDFEYGKIIGTVVIAGVTRKSKSYFAARGHEHWLLESPRRIAPRTAKGLRGWFSVELPGGSAQAAPTVK